MMYGDRSYRCHCVDGDGNFAPLLVDETAIFLGVNCFKCGRSAEHRLLPEDREHVRSIQRQRRRERNVMPDAEA